MKESPIGGKIVAPKRPLTLDVIVDCSKICILTSINLLSLFILHLCGKNPLGFGYLITVVSVLCSLSFSMRFST